MAFRALLFSFIVIVHMAVNVNALTVYLHVDSMRLTADVGDCHLKLYFIIDIVENFK